MHLFSIPNREVKTVSFSLRQLSIIPTLSFKWYAYHPEPSLTNISDIVAIYVKVERTQRKQNSHGARNEGFKVDILTVAINYISTGHVVVVKYCITWITTSSSAGKTETSL